MTLTISHAIVALTGIGYAIVGIQQGYKGNISGLIVWAGYAFAQIGLYMSLKAWFLCKSEKFTIYRENVS